ncbi:MAG: hypothetical protein U0Y68_20305 [Blastocatellia bacterium]
MLYIGERLGLGNYDENPTVPYPEVDIAVDPRVGRHERFAQLAHSNAIARAGRQPNAAACCTRQTFTCKKADRRASR